MWSSPRKTARGFARLRERNQLTLPQAVVDKMGLSLGDLVEFTASDRGTIEVRPARIVTKDTPEAQREEEAAKEDIRQGRYSAITSVDGFQQHMDQVRKGTAPAPNATSPDEFADSPGEDAGYNARMAALYREVVLKDKPLPPSSNPCGSWFSSVIPQATEDVSGLTESQLLKLAQLVDTLVEVKVKHFLAEDYRSIMQRHAADDTKQH